MPRTSLPGNKGGERASILIDAAVAILILCIGITAASFAMATVIHATAGSLDSVAHEIELRGDHEAAAFSQR
jgi:hypothetical protein